jgi:hypothetical protein
MLIQPSVCAAAAIPVSNIAPDTFFSDRDRQRLDESPLLDYYEQTIYLYIVYSFVTHYCFHSFRFKPTQTSTSVDATTLVDEKELKRRREKEERKKRREAQQQLKLLALPDVPSTKFQGFAGKLRRSMPLLQSFASLFKVICYSYANRELAFDMGIDEEVAEIALLCGSQPRVLDYCMFIIHVMLSDSFGVGDLMTVYTAEVRYIRTYLHSDILHSHILAYVCFTNNCAIESTGSVMDGFVAVMK